MEELILVFLILGLFIPIFGGVMWHLNRINPRKSIPKKAIEAADTSVSALYEVLTEQIKDISKLKDNTIKSLQNKLRVEQEEEEIDTKDTEVQYADIKTLVKKAYPQYAKFLDLPFAKKEIMKATKGMTLDEVISMVEEWTGKKVKDSAGFESGITTEENQPGYF